MIPFESKVSLEKSYFSSNPLHLTYCSRALVMSAKSSEKEKCMYPSIMTSSLWIGFETLSIEQEFKYVISSSKGI